MKKLLVILALALASIAATAALWPQESCAFGYCSSRGELCNSDIECGPGCDCFRGICVNDE